MAEASKKEKKTRVNKKTVKTEVPAKVAAEVETAPARQPKTPKVQNGYWGTGRRKTAIAKVQLVKGSGNILCNGKPYEQYFFQRQSLTTLVQKPLEATGNRQHYDVNAQLLGGGIPSQADALRMGISRALLEINADLRPKLKPLGLLTRDPRAKERKKYGQKRARKRFQYTKR